MRRSLKVHDVEHRAVVERERSGRCAQPQKTVLRGRVSIETDRQVLAQLQRLMHHSLPGRVRGMDVENEVATRIKHLVTQLGEKLKPEHQTVS